MHRCFTNFGNKTGILSIFIMIFKIKRKILQLLFVTNLKNLIFLYKFCFLPYLVDQKSLKGKKRKDSTKDNTVNDSLIA